MRKIAKSSRIPVAPARDVHVLLLAVGELLLEVPAHRDALLDRVRSWRSGRTRSRGQARTAPALGYGSWLEPARRVFREAARAWYASSKRGAGTLCTQFTVRKVDVRKCAVESTEHNVRKKITHYPNLWIRYVGHRTAKKPPAENATVTSCRQSAVASAVLQLHFTSESSFPGFTSRKKCKTDSVHAVPDLNPVRRAKLVQLDNAEPRCTASKIIEETTSKFNSEDSWKGRR